MMRLRQVAWAATDLQVAEDDIRRTFGLSVCFRDPGVATFGLANALFPVGDQFIEIVSPLPEHAADPDATAAGRLLAKRQASLGSDTQKVASPGHERGRAGYMVIVQTDDLVPIRARADRLGIRIVFEADGGTPGEPTSIHGLHFHPKDLGGAIVSIDRSNDAGEWAWAGPSWRDHVRTDTVDAITEVMIEVPQPGATMERWSALLGVQARHDSIELDDAVLRFGTGDGGVRSITLRTPEGATATFS